MKILLVGSGGREHAIAWRLSRIPGTTIYALPGNPGIARVAECIPAGPATPKFICAIARSLEVDLTVIGPEAPLVAGVVDHFRAANMAIVGPTAEAAQLEGSKQYAKKFFAQHNIPTARFHIVSNLADADAALKEFSLPVVIKADGLAAGKGVVIASTAEEARQAAQDLGPSLVIEEYLEGKEVSFIVLSDGRAVTPLLPSRDHKRIFDGDAGPNTGGMGALCDPTLLTDAETTQIMERIIWPTVEAASFTGFLYAGVMLTSAGPKLLEFNVRLGDPEAQAILYLLEDDLPETLMSVATRRLSSAPLKWRAGASLCVVAASSGYPGPFRSSDPISGIENAEGTGATVFHAGTRVGWSGYLTAGGRVLGVTARGEDRESAARNCYKAIEQIRFEGMHYRRDIGGTTATAMMTKAGT